jgi:hypothetical protein
LVFAIGRKPQLLPMIRPFLLPMLFNLWRDLKTVDTKEQAALAGLAEVTGQSPAEANEEFQAFLAGLGLADEPEAPDDGRPVHPEPPGPEVEPEADYEVGDFDLDDLIPADGRVDAEPPIVGMGRAADL